MCNIMVEKNDLMQIVRTLKKTFRVKKYEYGVLSSQENLLTISFDKGELSLPFIGEWDKVISLLLHVFIYYMESPRLNDRITLIVKDDRFFLGNISFGCHVIKKDVVSEITPKADIDSEDAKCELRKNPIPLPDKIAKEVIQLHAILKCRLSVEASCQVLRYTKTLLAISSDKSEARIISGILGGTYGRLTRDDAVLVYRSLIGISGPTTAEGAGSSAENAVIINATSSLVGVPEEYSYVGRMCGKKGVDYTSVTQILVNHNERNYEVLNIKMKDGSVRTFWFDITSFFGKS